ncbi:Rossmann-fold NAD(P)-binding domain-containing protein [Burkholderia alba]|uniref:hypothetical protein n=1 Tax=Burkholderia alba TaxID=2683677 RepID=UPI002B05F77A|nr:hypothetical protein [Burkholderia alba]
MIVSETIIDDYAESAGKRRAATYAISGHQPGDPAKGAAAVIAAMESDAPPLRLLLGRSALDVAFKRLDALRENVEAWRDLTESTDYPAS